MTRPILLLAIALAACAGDGPPAGVAPGSGLAVVNSDYVSTNISVLDPDTGALIEPSCIDSGTQTPQNTLALSGDVTLPSQPQATAELLAIDRINGTLTWITPATCAPSRQLDVSTGFFANPHDVISVSATKAYVLRYERNPNPTDDPDDLDDGDDVLVIDPSIPEITGRIPLAAYAVEVAGAATQARPDRARLVGDTLIVALSSLSDDFQTAGHGRLVLIDPATDEVTGTVELPTLANCGGLSHVEATGTLVVACAGVFADDDPAARSGLAYVDLDASPPEVTATVPVAPFDGRALAGYAAIARDGALGLGVTYGDLDGEPRDQLWAYDVEAGTATELDVARGSFTFGTVLVDPGRDRVYLTDADAATPRVHLYDLAGAPSLDRSVDPNPGIGLPPREIAWY